MKKVKSYLSFRFLEATAYFAKEALDYESKEEKPNDYYNYILPSGIISIVTFLEAYINELCSEIADNEIYTLNPLMINNKDNILNFCKNVNSPVERFSTLDKYDKFLEAVNVEKLDKSRSPYQDINALISLRNSLIHYDPVWHNVNKNDQESKLKNLLNNKYTLCPYYDNNEEPFFPYLCLSADCLQWAINCSIAFVSNFHKKLVYYIPLKETFETSVKKINIKTA